MCSLQNKHKSGSASWISTIFSKHSHVIGFHLPQYCFNFGGAVQSTLGYDWNREKYETYVGDRVVKLLPRGIGVNFSYFDGLGGSEETTSKAREIKKAMNARHDERGALVLGELAGVAREFPDLVAVNPFDIERGASAIKDALEMPEQKRKDTMQRMRRHVREKDEKDLKWWIEENLNRLVEV